jgi:hypothetical protein
MRTLGTWIGNNVDDTTPWEPIINKVYKNLKIWNKSHPTLVGRMIIVQAIIGACTQYLAMAQGMPKHIESALIRIIKIFMWNDSTNLRIALETLYYPVEDDGLNLLNITLRNEAIEIMWLKMYLTPSMNQPMWAKITDVVIDAATPKTTT